MFHKPAHKDTSTPPGQVRNPAPTQPRQASWDRYQASRNCTCGPVRHWECNAGCKAQRGAA